ncbi:phage tail tube protein [uncultured Microbacterium sp.]|uniref:phage tail tube protein n=1 Tax=uncultured Microbacterium sp. TaxID=191216 RepID=UPI0025E38D3B|nr:phage tail tube protein [uncultured Microbacterium sp.]
MTIQADCSIGFKKETTYGTSVVPDRFLEFTSETIDFDRTYYQGNGMRPGSRLARSARRSLTKDGGKGDIELEVPTRGLGTFLEALLGVGASTMVSAGLYQQLFTLIKDDFLPSMTLQKGIPRLGANTVDAYTALGAVCSSFDFTLANADVLKVKSSWTAREVRTDVAYATPSYASAAELFTFVGAGLVIGGAVTVPTTTALATGGTTVANIRDFSISVDQKLDANGYNIGGGGKRTRRPAVGIAEVKGKVTAEYDAITFRDALASQAPLALVANFQAATDITSGNKPTLQITVPDIRFEGELPKSNGGDVITQSIDFTGFDGLVAPHALYVAVRTADTAL